MDKKIKVLIVDDSALVRQVLKEILNSDQQIEVIATAANPYIAVKKIQKETPNVITLDIEMPQMDGLTFLKKIMHQHPIPVIMISRYTQKGSKMALKALDYGAVEIIAKPLLGHSYKKNEFKTIVCDSVKAAAQAKIKTIPIEQKIEDKLSADAVLSLPKNLSTKIISEKIIFVGASTGGTEAIFNLLKSLSRNAPGIVIVQHMAEGFTKAFADRLNSHCQIAVKEAENRDKIIKGHALLAPGNKHILIKHNGSESYVEVKDGPLVNRHRPSVDVLFRSAARYVGKNAVGIILTGMGDDGAKGILEMKQAGAKTIAQDEKSCVVFGMPKEAIKLGGVDQVVALEKIPKVIYQMLN